MKRDNIYEPTAGIHLPVDDAQGNLAHIEAIIAVGKDDPQSWPTLDEALDKMMEQHEVLNTVWKGNLTESERDRVVTQLTKKGRTLWKVFRRAASGRVLLQDVEPSKDGERAKALYTMVFVKGRNMSKGDAFDFWKLTDGLLDEIREEFTPDQLASMSMQPVFKALEDNHTELGMQLSITIGIPAPVDSPSVQKALRALRETTRSYVLRLHFLADSDPSQREWVKHRLAPLDRWQAIADQHRKAKQAEEQKAKAEKAKAKQAEKDSKKGKAKKSKGKQEASSTPRAKSGR